MFSTWLTKVLETWVCEKVSTSWIEMEIDQLKVNRYRRHQNNDIVDYQNRKRIMIMVNVIILMDGQMGIQTVNP